MLKSSQAPDTYNIWAIYVMKKEVRLNEILVKNTMDGADHRQIGWLPANLDKIDEAFHSNYASWLPEISWKMPVVLFTSRVFKIAMGRKL